MEGDRVVREVAGGGVIEHPVIILAAGKSSRLGEPKGLVAVQGEPWLGCQIERLGECGAARVVVVLGYDWDAYASAIPWLVRAVELGSFLFAGVRVQVARNMTPDRGSFSSLVRGIEALDASDHAYVLPVDVPCAGRPVWALLSDAMQGGVDAAVAVHAGRGGHPVLCSPRMLQALRAIPPDAPGARLDAQLRALPPAACARVAVDDVRVTMNLNTRDDWHALAGGVADDR